ncbi:hypothetical protein X975_18462, partial [Stegodyphus mimosarum]
MLLCFIGSEGIRNMLKGKSSYRQTVSKHSCSDSRMDRRQQTISYR